MKSILDKKIEKYCNWYFNNIVIPNNNEPFTNRNLAMNTIQKMAIWYELRYPDNFFYDDGLEINDLMLNKNKYLDLEDEESINKSSLRWKDYFNYDVFYNMLTEEEQDFFKMSNFARTIRLVRNTLLSDHIHINNEGIVTEAELTSILYGISPYEIENHTLIEASKILIKRGVLDNIKEIKRVAHEIDVERRKREGFLGSVMYMILERGGCRIGPRRAMLFAKEFNRSIKIPMIYGIDKSDPNLLEFIEDYLSSGGNPDILCYKDYYLKDYEKISLSEIYANEKKSRKKLIKQIEE